MTKCIGGKFDGESVPDADKRVLMRKPVFPSMSVFDSLPDEMDQTTTLNAEFQWYTRRGVMCHGSEVTYYAPEEWSDEQAIRHALT
jgi:hypothetical protein